VLIKQEDEMEGSNKDWWHDSSWQLSMGWRWVIQRQMWLICCVRWWYKNNEKGKFGTLQILCW